jgi:hypothetical protein
MQGGNNLAVDEEFGHHLPATGQVKRFELWCMVAGNAHSNVIHYCRQSDEYK